jgi:hypothetical protein
MSITITPNIQKIIDSANAMPEVISLKVGSVPSFELTQVPAENYVYFDFVMIVKNGDRVSVAFVVPESSITENTHMNLAIKDLAECNCVRSGDADDQYCVDNPFYNRGKTTYYIRPPDDYLVRLIQQEPKIYSDQEMPLALQGMVEKLKTLDNVNSIQVEDILDDTFIGDMQFHSDPLRLDEKPKDLIIIQANVQLTSGTVDLSFVCSEWQYNDAPEYTWAVNNLKEMITLVIEQTK